MHSSHHNILTNKHRHFNNCGCNEYSESEEDVCDYATVSGLGWQGLAVKDNNYWAETDKTFHTIGQILSKENTYSHEAYTLAVIIRRGKFLSIFDNKHLY